MTNDGLSTFDLIDILSSPTAVMITAVIILIGYGVMRLFEAGKSKRGSAEFNRKISNPDIKCPHCSQDLEQALENNMAKFYHKEVIVVDCPKCKTRSKWDVIGWPPVLQGKVSRAI